MRESMTDERLDQLAERFHRYGVLSLCRVPFHKYVLYPDQFDLMAQKIWRESWRRWQ